jgi:superoxide dismutase, Fe-Mn family
MEHKLPKLNYRFDELEPHIDAKTMEIHYTKHHQNYINKLNETLAKYPLLQEKTAEELIIDLENLPAEIRTIVRNNAGGHINHSLFWEILKRNIKINGDILSAIDKKFSDFANFKKIFSTSANKLFGSGWTWLVVNNGELEIMNTFNQDSPIINEKIPILGIDLWEHAYYLKFQNKRSDYIETFFHVIDWNKVNENYINALNKQNKIERR